MARPDEQGNLEVCAYVVQKPGSEFAPAGLREHAARQLPDYMVLNLLYRSDRNSAYAKRQSRPPQAVCARGEGCQRHCLYSAAK
nr:hypothetical protein P5642_13665 [Bacillus subtilis]